MPKRATIIDVAKLAGVSTATVSRVLNEIDKVSPETADRVQQAITTLGYVPNSAAQGLAGKKRKTIGIVIPSVNSAFLSTLVRSVNLAAKDNYYNLLIYATEDQTSLHADIPLPLNEHLTDGLLIFTNSVDDASILHFYTNGFPLVLLYRSPIEGTQIPCVGLRNRRGAFKLFEHLIATCDRRRIAFLVGPAGNEDSHWR